MNHITQKDPYSVRLPIKTSTPAKSRTQQLHSQVINYQEVYQNSPTIPLKLTKPE